MLDRTTVLAGISDELRGFGELVGSLFVLAATGRRDPATLGLDASINVYA